MEKYTVKRGQNIFDVALTLYGTIEGLFDLLLSNPAITLETKLESGMELLYHDNITGNPSIVSWLQTKNIVVRNGEHSSVMPMDEPPIMLISQQGMNSAITFQLKANTTLAVDWGDLSPVETYSSITQTTIEHSYNSSEQHTITLGGNGQFNLLDLTEVHGNYYCIEAIVADSFLSTIPNQESNLLITTT